MSLNITSNLFLNTPGDGDSTTSLDNPSQRLTPTAAAFPQLWRNTTTDRSTAALPQLSHLANITPLGIPSQPISLRIPNISLAVWPCSVSDCSVPHFCKFSKQPPPARSVLCHFLSELMVLPSKIQQQILSMAWTKFASGNKKAPSIIHNPVGLIYLLATDHALQAYLFLTVSAHRSFQNS